MRSEAYGSKIYGVKVAQIDKYPDERGWFHEIVRNQPHFAGGIQQVSYAVRYRGVANGWHVHKDLCECICVVSGLARVVLRDVRGDPNTAISWVYRPGMNPPSLATIFDTSVSQGIEEHYTSGDTHTMAILIPPGVAHGYKVLEGPCGMVYVASTMYDPNDEGRIDPDEWGSEWYQAPAVR